MNDEILKYWIALKSIKGIGHVSFPALVDRFGSPAAVFGASVSDLQQTEEFPVRLQRPLFISEAGIMLKQNLNLFAKMTLQ